MPLLGAGTGAEVPGARAFRQAGGSAAMQASSCFSQDVGAIPKAFAKRPVSRSEYAGRRAGVG